MSNVSMIDGHIDEPKVTDEKIIEAWEKILLMGDAPIGEYWQIGITTKLAKDTLDILNRQNAEIDRLNIVKREYQYWYDEARAEIERLQKIELAPKGYSLTNL